MYIYIYIRSLIETVRSTSPATTIIVSGPLPTYRRGHERFSRLFALNEWLFSWCTEQKILFVNNWNLFWERPRLFRADGLHPSRVGAELLSDNITRTLRSIWLVSQFSNNSYDDFCSTHLNDKGTCSVQSIQTVSVPRIVSSKYKFNAGSRTNLIVIKPEKCKINEQKLFLKLGLLNIRSLTPKAVIVNEIITDNSFDVFCLTETWLKTNDYFGLNESTPPSYCYKHEPRETGRGAVSQQYIVIFSMLLRKQDTGLTHSKCKPGASMSAPPPPPRPSRGQKALLRINKTISCICNSSITPCTYGLITFPCPPF